jgi:hypothetical protein
MTLFFSSCDCAREFKPFSSGKHLPGCLMDSNCFFCGQKPFFCRMMGKCAGIQKTSKHDQPKADFLLKKKKCEILEVFKNFGDEMKLFYRWSPFSNELISKIFELRNKVEDFKKKSTVTIADIQQIEVVLFKMRRICYEQRAIYDKQLADELQQAEFDCEELGPPVRSE